jgi:hypothetical protein
MCWWVATTSFRHSLVIYPGTLQNMVFSSADSPSDELHTRTADGLQVGVGSRPSLVHLCASGVL